MSVLDDADFGAIAERFNQEIADGYASGLAVHFGKMEVPDPAAQADSGLPWDVVMGLIFLKDRAKRAEWRGVAPVAKLARLEVWAPDGPSEFLNKFIGGREQEEIDSLRNWILSEAATSSEGQGAHSAIRFALRLPLGASVPLLRVLKDLPEAAGTSHPIPSPKLFDEMRKAGILTVTEQAAIAKPKVEAAALPGAIFREFDWYRRWFFADPSRAWKWFTTHVESITSEKDAQLRLFAENIGSLKPGGAFAGDCYAEILAVQRRSC
jgi:hypothetical protein